jgi:hypothetical protein
MITQITRIRQFDGSEILKKHSDGTHYQIIPKWKEKWNNKLIGNSKAEKITTTSLILDSRNIPII